MVKLADLSVTQGLVRALKARSEAVTEAFARAAESTAKWAHIRDTHVGSRQEYLALHFQVFTDYLVEFADRGDTTFRDLFVMEKIKALYEPDTSDEDLRSRTRAVAQLELAQLTQALQAQVDDEALQWLSGYLDGVLATLVADAQKTQRVLLVGDCVFLDIVAFVVGPLREAGIRLAPEFLATKNPVELRDQLRKLADQKFDAVFFSPFTYEFAPHLERLGHWRTSLKGDAEAQTLMQQAWGEVRQTLELLADLFDCPVHVHNASMILRDESDLKRRVKLLATKAGREQVRAEFNGLLAREVESQNARSFPHLFVLDELALVAGREFEAGGYIYRSALQHPVVFGRMLAPAYVDRIVANAWLNKRKVVVVDLDNTMWNGVIGEGAGVEHYHDRQATLKKLKGKGVVLAINSKNDPKNVHWTGGTLSDSDFVCAAISWQPKVQGMRQIQAMLNLKMKDYVFIDDRADELELMRSTYPEVLCLDATDSRVWQRLAAWCELLDDDAEMDRTLMYQQREQRKAFIKEDVATDDERAAMFSTLELRLAITRPRPEELKRVTELVNRTNQFNLEGLRTNLREVTQWYDSSKHLILTGQSADRFGDMGTTCVAIAAEEGADLRILAFVLSCRVFGYGIETSVLNQLKQAAVRRGLKTMSGRYVATPHNAPCKDFLPSNGFDSVGDREVHSLQGAAVQPVPWIAVSVAADAF